LLLLSFDFLFSLKNIIIICEMTEMCKMSLCRSYGGTGSLKARVSAAVLQKNEGYTWVNKV
jgi:hypothetical protein